MIRLVEPCAGSAALTRHLLGAGPLVGYQGGKDGYAERIAALMGIAGCPNRVTLADAGPWQHIWRALRDSPMRLVSDLAAFASMSAKEAWTRCRRENDGAAAWLVRFAGTFGGCEVGGFKGQHKHRPNVSTASSRREPR